MTTFNENTPAPAATGNEGNESIRERSTEQPTDTRAHLHYRGASTGIHTATLDGTRIPRGDTVHLVVHRDAVLEYLAHGTPLQVCLDCVDEHNHRVRESQQEREIREEIEREVRRRWMEREIHQLLHGSTDADGAGQ